MRRAACLFACVFADEAELLLQALFGLAIGNVAAEVCWSFRPGMSLHEHEVGMINAPFDVPCNGNKPPFRAHNF
jgi:hypothetical protein